MKVYVTKYALTTGVSVHEVRRCNQANMVVDEVKGDGLGSRYHRKPDWHEDRNEAVARVREMRDRKIRSLRKALARLEAIDPEQIVPEPQTKEAA